MMEGNKMESLELRIFKEVAYAKSISRAAENMGYVQSNITAHIKKLETELNITLLIRHAKGVTLTDEGEKFLHYAEQIVSLLDEAAELFRKEKKTLKIGTTQTIAGYLLPECLCVYKKSYPNTSISVTTFNQTDMEEKLYNATLDCILTNSPHIFSSAQEIFEIKEQLVLITPVSCQSIADIYNFPIIVNNITSCPYRFTLLKWLLSHRSKTPEIIEFDTVEGILHAVSLGMGISLLPKRTLSNNTQINQFYIEELQTVSIKMWVSKNKSLSQEILELKSIIKS